MVRYIDEVIAALEEERDPRFAAMDDGEVEEAVRGGAAEIAAATCRWLHALAELVRRGIWADQGARTPAQWLSWAISMRPSTAREHVRVALRLRDYPAVDEVFSRGEISYTKVRAITRCERPELEDLLLTYARHATGSQMEEIVAGLRRTDDRDDAPDPYDERSVTWRWRDEDTMEVRIILPTDLAEAMRQRIERRVDQLDAEQGRGASAEAPRTPRSALAADAFVEAVAEMSEELPSTDGSGHEVVVHVPAEALERPEPGRARRAPVRGVGRRVPAMPQRMARRLACDAALRVVAHDEEGREVGASRRRRRPSPALRRRLAERDRGCRFPGCDVRRGLHAHHIVHWADGGPTTAENLVLLCAHHHRFVHDRGWDIHQDGMGRVRFARPDERIVPPVARLRLPSFSVLERDGGMGPPADALQARGDGRPADIGLAVALLHEEIARLQPPEPAAAAA